MAPCDFFFAPNMVTFASFFPPKQPSLLVSFVATLQKFATKKTLVEAVTRVIYTKNKTNQ
jgi:hypothetical protein